MNIEEKFVFDLEGYIVIKGVLSPDEVAELNDLADRKFETYPYGGAEQGREMSLIPWGDPVKKLIDHPRVLPYLVELLGPRFGSTTTTECSCVQVTATAGCTAVTAAPIGTVSTMAPWKTASPW